MGWESTSLPGVNGQPLYIVNSSTVNVGTNSGNGAIRVLLVPVPAVGSHKAVPTLLFTNNVAGRGGGAVYVDTQNSHMFMLHGTTFAGNTVTGADGVGGALAFDDGNEYVYAFSVAFVGNSASSGGAVAFSKSNSVLNFYGCSFVSNTAISRGGGGVYAGYQNGQHATDCFGACSANPTANALRFDNCSFTNNTANGSGGGVYMDDANVVILLKSLFIGNTAYEDGGACAVVKGSQILLSDTSTYVGNWAGLNGGAVAVSKGNVVNINGTTVFDGNYAGLLSVFGYVDDVLSTIGVGGAMYVAESSLLFGYGLVTMSNNFALAGSAIFHVTTPSADVHIVASPHKILMEANYAWKGGTVYAVVYESWSDRNTAHERNRVIFKDNVGGDAVTQSRRLVGTGGGQKQASDGTIHVRAYGTPIRPSPSFTLLDGYGNLNSTDNSSTVTAYAHPSYYYCGGDGRIGYLSGVTTTKVTAGVAMFTSLQAYCYPGGNMTVLFVASLDGFDSSYNVETSVTLLFRPCIDGEVLKDNVCERCPEGSYSLRFSPAAQCVPCPSDAVSCSGNVIVVSEGYWRPSPLSTVFLECPYPAGCAGGAPTVTSDVASSCAAGYEGPLCSACSSGYYLNRATKECTTCAGGNGPGQLAILIVVPLSLLAVAFLAFSRLDDIKEALTNALNTSRRSDNDRSVSAAAKNVFSKAVDRVLKLVKGIDYDQVVPKIKIAISSLQVCPRAPAFSYVYGTPELTTHSHVPLQIITNFPDTLNMHFPAAAGSTMSALSFVNLVTFVGSLQCYTGRFDYVGRMILVTMLPLGLVVVLVASFLAHRAYLIRKRKDWEHIIQRYVSMFLFITYLVLPGCTTTILKVFACKTIDPEGLLSGAQSYLQADYSIQCGSARHRFGVAWAAVCIVVYPIGIPSLYMFLLYLAKDQIKEHKQERKKKEHEVKKQPRQPKLPGSVRSAGVSLRAQPAAASAATAAAAAVAADTGGGPQSGQRRGSTVTQALQVSLDTLLALSTAGRYVTDTRKHLACLRHPLIYLRSRRAGERSQCAFDVKALTTTTTTTRRTMTTPSRVPPPAPLQQQQQPSPRPPLPSSPLRTLLKTRPKTSPQPLPQTLPPMLRRPCRLLPPTGIRASACRCGGRQANRRQRLHLPTPLQRRRRPRQGRRDRG